MPLGRALVLLALLANPTVSVAPGTPCVDEARVRERLRAERIDDSLRVRVSFDAEAVTVEAERDGGPGLRRRIPLAHENCASVERIISALVTAWARPSVPALTGEAADAGSARRNPEEAASDGGVQPLAPAGTGPKPRRAASGDGGVFTVASHGVDAGLVSSAASALVEPGDAGALAPPLLSAEGPTSPLAEAADAVAAPAPTEERAATAVSRDARPVVSPAPVEGPPPRWLLGVSVLGGVAFGPTPQVTGQGSALVVLARGRWGLALEGGFESARTAELSPGRIWASTQWGSVGASVAFRPSEGWSLDVVAAFRFTHVLASSEDVALTRSARLWGLGAVLSGGVARHVVGPLFVEARVSASVRSPTERFTIQGADGALVLGPWQVGAFVGARLELPVSFQAE